MNTEDLRDKFNEETNVAPVFANRSPYINYINWLEGRLVNILNLQNVSNRRELLIAFMDFAINQDREPETATAELIVDAFIKSNL